MLHACYILTGMKSIYPRLHFEKGRSICLHGWKQTLPVATIYRKGCHMRWRSLTSLSVRVTLMSLGPIQATFLGGHLLVQCCLRQRVWCINCWVLNFSEQDATFYPDYNVTKSGWLLFCIRYIYQQVSAVQLFLFSPTPKCDDFETFPSLS